MGTYDHELYLGLASYLCSFAALTGFQENFNCYSYPKQPGSPQHPLTCRTVSTSWSRFERIGCQRYGLHKKVNFETAGSGYQFSSQGELLPVSVAEW